MIPIQYPENKRQRAMQKALHQEKGGKHRVLKNVIEIIIPTVKEGVVGRGGRAPTSLCLWQLLRQGV